MNIYAGVPEDMGERVQEAATLALQVQIERAIMVLHEKQGGQFTAVIRLLQALIGDED